MLIFFSDYLCDVINECIEKGLFPDCIKLANILPMFKKDSKLDKNDFRPVSILPLLSKIFERVIHVQISEYTDKTLSHLQCGFRKNQSTQDCLMLLVEMWKEALYRGIFFDALLTDLSKAFDCISHFLMIAKLDAYGFDNNACTLILNYLSNRKQRVKIGNCYSRSTKISKGVPQGSILGPLLFNIYICDLFYLLDNNVASYADDTAPFAIGESFQEIKEKLELVSCKLLSWLSNNQVKGIPKNAI